MMETCALRWLLCLALVGCEGRGETSTSPSATVATSSPPVGAMSTPFSQAGVDHVVETHRAEILTACTASAAELPATLELVFEVERDGSVADVAVMGGGAAARLVRECVEQRAKWFRFGPPGEPTTATASLAL